MAKQFQARISKRDRKAIDFTDRLGLEIFNRSDKKLLEGALLDKIRLADIIIKDQVRTKFNDNSIRELAKNIQANGLIQPLVVHRSGAKYTLICGERRYRALNLINKKEVSCYILENKTHEELMAIQFSENSSREALHYVDKANGIYNYKMATNATERKIQSDLGISKSDVHRSLLVAKMSESIKTAAKTYNVE
ncbi:MAG: ParB/RepB/Spo0J family partition protein, partial [Halobacteriovoraceae bacterium]|nr:ParB/RepB/Spo0J family partition protein [Halobacteriovoraceae bacterium]